MSLVLKVACPKCGSHQDSPLGVEVRCDHCGSDFRAVGHGEASTRIVSVTPDDQEHIPYSQRVTEVPRNTISSLVVADPALLDEKMLRDLPMKDNARFAGKVRLIKKLGEGGMGAVYRGFDESLALDVAVKVLPIPPGGKELHFADRFHNEARLSAQINHPNVVRMRDVGEQGGLVYLVMDFVDGLTARQMLDRKGFIPVPQALQIVHDASLGMQAAHERGIVHRDIKPENILVASDGRVMITDLGLAKGAGTRFTDSLLPITRMGLLLGTPEYMSPEQWDIGASVTPRSDIWSMGVTLWVLLTRRAPFEDADLGQLAKKIKEAPLPDIHVIRPDVPQRVASILYHCLAKNPQRRFMNAAELVNALTQAMQRPDEADDDFIPASSQTLAATQSAYQESRAAKTSSASAAQKTHAGPYKQPALAIPASVTQPKSKPDAAPRKKKRSATRTILLWGGLPAAAACAAFAFHHFVGFNSIFGKPPDNSKLAIAETQPAPKAPDTTAKKAAVVAPVAEISLDISAPQRVKPGDKAVLHATLNGVADASKYKIVWKCGKDEQTGVEIPAVFDVDKSFDVSALDNAGKEVAHKQIAIETDLVVSALEVAAEGANAPSHLEGFVRGGPGADKLEYRWYDTKNPTLTLSDKTVFEPSGNEAGLKMYAFQARRKGTRDWAAAPSDKVAVQIRPQVPAEFTQAMASAESFMKKAEAAETGSAAQAALVEAQNAFDRALDRLPENIEARQRKIECMKRRKAVDAYVSLMGKSRERLYEAEKIAASMPHDKVTALEQALEPLYEAQTTLRTAELRVYPELSSEITRLKNMKEKYQNLIAQQEIAYTEYQTRIDKARQLTEDAAKYDKLSDQLPYWEKAVESYLALKRDYPSKVKEFELYMERAQEKRDKAYLYTTIGILPGKPEDPIYRKQKVATPPAKALDTPSVPAKDKEPGQLIDP
ncbi:MAG TPA: protein kinase [Planctomycetota bacterium]|nr:protein kinase [Planctomycetota bacterium]